MCNVIYLIYYYYYSKEFFDKIINGEILLKPFKQNNRKSRGILFYLTLLSSFERKY